MARGVATARTPRTRLPLAAALLLGAALLPPGWLGAVRWVAGVADTLLIPVQDPVAAAGRWIAGRAVGGNDLDPALRQARADAEQFKTMWLQASDEQRRLQETLAAINRGLAVNPAVRPVHVTAAVIGQHGDLSGGLLKVRAGRTDGVTRGAVAVLEGVNLLGRVVDVDARFSRVAPTTDAAAGASLTGVILESELGAFGEVGVRGGGAGAEGAGAESDRPALVGGVDSIDGALRCRLSPRPGGAGAGRAVLEGEVFSPAGGAGSGRGGGRVRVGAVVRVLDDSWPRSAQMLVIGDVERVEEKANGRQRLVVRPRYELSRLSEVMLRFVAEDEERSSPASGRAGSP